VGVGVVVKELVGVGASAVWVLWRLAVVAVACASRSSWEGLQAHKIKTVAMTLKREMIDLPCFITVSPKIPYLRISFDRKDVSTNSLP
jgi:hypothetical protein